MMSEDSENVEKYKFWIIILLVMLFFVSAGAMIGFINKAHEETYNKVMDCYAKGGLYLEPPAQRPVCIKYEAIK